MDKNIYNNMLIKDLSKYASKYEDAIYLKDDHSDIRPSYFHDIDRILYSTAFTRYMDKTQVFTHRNNDHIQRRMTHVQYVSKIARTIGRALNLNEDLIEAASLGHDLGHTPYGHVGEKILNDISLEHNEGMFNHNIESVRVLKDIENFGEGLNVSVQVLDAIMCHNGEFALGEYHKKEKTKEEFLEEYNKSYEDVNLLKDLKPMTLEGCVVRVSDLIAYLGKDIEDAIRLKIISYKDIPEEIKEVLGLKNGEIVNTIILDIINNSYGKDYIKLSDDIYKAILKLKKFNYENIYYKSYDSIELMLIEHKFRTLFDNYLEELEDEDSTIRKVYLNSMKDCYKKNTKERIAIDYIAGMTDSFFLNEYERVVNKNKEISYNK